MLVIRRFEVRVGRIDICREFFLSPFDSTHSLILCRTNKHPRLLIELIVNFEHGTVLKHFKMKPIQLIVQAATEVGNGELEYLFNVGMGLQLIDILK